MNVNLGGHLESTYLDGGHPESVNLCTRGEGGSKFLKILRRYYVDGHKE